MKKEDFKSPQNIRWCPGCGDYAILSSVQRTLAEANVQKENVVFVSGIGCSSRFPYYMSTYGFHTIHGRAPCVATGIKKARPELSVWIISGDGDSLSIGTNHFVHLIRRNIDVNYLIFNNRIYGLTKGQYSPTSEKGKITRSSPHGTVDRALNPLSLALASGATFVARCIDRNIKHICQILHQAMAHRGTSIIEIYQNCNIFNDGTFDRFSNPSKKEDHALYLEKDAPLVYGAKEKKGIFWDEKKKWERSIISKNIENEKDFSKENLLRHNPQSRSMAELYMQLEQNDDFPTPFGLIYQEKTKEDKYIDKNKKFLNPNPEDKRKEKLEKLQKKIQQSQTWEM